MTGSVDIHVFIGNYFSALAQEFVDHVHYEYFIADDGIGRKNDSISGGKFDITVFTVGDAVKCRKTFSLGAGAEDDCFVFGVVA